MLELNSPDDKPIFVSADDFIQWQTLCYTKPQLMRLSRYPCSLTARVEAEEMKRQSLR